MRLKSKAAKKKNQNSRKKNKHASFPNGKCAAGVALVVRLLPDDSFTFTAHARDAG